MLTMAASKLARLPIPPYESLLPFRRLSLSASSRHYPPCPPRTFSSARIQFQRSSQHRKQSFRARLNFALKNTRVQWYTIPVGLGIAFLGLTHFSRVTYRERERLRR